MVKKWLLFGLAFLMVVWTAWSGLAYQVGVPLEVQARLQYDNGVVTSNVVVPSCLLSVYDESLASLVVRDGVMGVSGVYQNYSFVPASVGGYVVSVQCVYLNESIIFHDLVSVDNVVVPSGSVGGRVLNLDAKLVVAKSSYVVNIATDSVLNFDASYFLGGNPTNSNVARWSVVSGDKVLDSGGFVLKSTGVYGFSFDFKDYVTGDYKLLLTFDGRSQSLDLKVISVGSDMSLITGAVTNSDGSVSVLKLGGWIFILLFVLLLLVLVVRSVSKGSKGGNNNGGGQQGFRPREPVQYKEIPR